MEMLTFEDFLKQKKIDSRSFHQGDLLQWEEFKRIFEQVHPDSFTAQKLFQINQIRRKYPHMDQPVPEGSATTGAAKPKMPFKPKIGK
jgi:hypothetical protein